MGKALYRKYRSRSLSEVVGQEHVTTLLKNALSSGRIAHAYLFTGPRGVGKTSIARILAHEINKLPYNDESSHLDIIEIDAASNNGVEDIRDLRDRVQITPVSADKKVYIVDEVHMLSKAAFNALLKTLEEPPEHVIFILATTDIDKVPETIISRTQRHTFRRASASDIVKNLLRITEGESINADTEALELIAKHADGSFRDSVSLFDQLLSGSGTSTITTEHVIKSLGLASDQTIEELLQAASKGDISSIDTLLTGLENQGIPPRTTAMQLADCLRKNLLDNPQYPELIDSLLDVSKSQYPELKLLTVLSLFAQPDLEKPLPETPKPSSPPKSQATISKAVSSQNLSVTISSPAPVTSSTQAPTEKKSEPAKKAVTATPSTVANDFSWDALIAHVRTHYVALHSVLSKCEPELDGDILTLYTKSSFYKKKLDDPKYRSLIGNSLIELGFELDIETIASQKPLKDSQAAKVAAIMGGGEEVSVDDAQK
jgi:DNA polymerase III subunit gamma/tau